ncbi:hypothetical protein CCH79_00007347 [Gambusia affinis]|uniref:Uncharacterized protein n=1 Tax=Gambusia affinis TaxID=33528 RepID=A0A315VBV3_GAMAF|nr:hypothetical protein CCH79_00007347 [Gambusia affinis]
MLFSNVKMTNHLSPPCGEPRPSPVAVVRVTGHGGGVLGQSGSLGCLSDAVERCFPHRGALPQPGAPLLLSALHAAAAAAVQSVHLRHENRRNVWMFLLTFPSTNAGVLEILGMGFATALHHATLSGAVNRKLQFPEGTRAANFATHSMADMMIVPLLQRRRSLMEGPDSRQFRLGEREASGGVNRGRTQEMRKDF